MASGESDYGVCPRPLRQFYACFTPVYIGLDGLPGTPVCIGLRQFMLVGRDMELDSKFVLETVRNDIVEVTLVHDDVKTTIGIRVK